MSESAVNITVDPKTINDIVTAQIRTAIAASLQSQAPAMVEKIVDFTMKEMVDDKGVKSRGYSSDVPFIEWASRHAIQNAIKEEIEKWISQRKNIIHQAIENELLKSKTKLVKQMAESCVQSMMAGWNFKFEVHADKR